MENSWANIRLCADDKRGIRRPALRPWLRRFDFFTRLINADDELAIWQRDSHHVWFLYQRNNYQRLSGELVDEPDFGSKKAISDQNRNLLRSLNEGRCFDFDFEPHEHDLLVLRLSKDKDVRLTFYGGKWNLEGSPVVIETWDHWLLKNGKIIPIIS